MTNPVYIVCILVLIIWLAAFAVIKSGTLDKLLRNVLCNLKAAWKYHTGRSPNATNIDDLLCTASANSMQMAAISEALRLAARNASGSITGYACQCMNDWAGRGLHTLSEIFEADIAQNGLLPAT